MPWSNRTLGAQAPGSRRHSTSSSFGPSPPPRPRRPTTERFSISIRDSAPPRRYVDGLSLSPDEIMMAPRGEINGVAWRKEGRWVARLVFKLVTLALDGRTMAS